MPPGVSNPPYLPGLVRSGGITLGEYKSMKRDKPIAFITCPNFTRHGGIRIIMEWANRLTATHQVKLRVRTPIPPNWFILNPNVVIVLDDTSFAVADLVIICSPHAHDYVKLPSRGKKFVFLQMMEHLFKPGVLDWMRKCETLYRARCPVLVLAAWQKDYLETVYGRDPYTTHIVGNGVNFKDFPIITSPKKENCVLVEGWLPGNPTKDLERIGPQAATWLRQTYGVKVLAYGTKELPAIDAWRPDEYVLNPTTAQLNQLYERARLLIKATRYDASACAPMEAMTKQTPTVRAINHGDDQLRYAYRCSYHLPHYLRLLKEVWTGPNQVEEMGRLGQKYILQEGDWERQWQRIIGLLNA